MQMDALSRCAGIGATAAPRRTGAWGVSPRVCADGHTVLMSLGGATAAPRSSGAWGVSPRGWGPGGWSPWTIQCLRSGFWVGLAKRAQQEEEVGVGVCFHPSFHACCRLCLS